MILKLYREIAGIAERFLVVESTKIIYLSSGVPQKLRIFIVDGTILDVWLTLSGKYSYHWDRRLIDKGIYRFDNAPHKKWKHISTFPHHFHSGEEKIVKESHLPEKPQSAIEDVLNFIVTVLKKEKSKTSNK